MRARALVMLLAASLATAIGCVIGLEQAPGCHVDAECGEGWTCRAGACFHDTTGRTNGSVDDAGDAGGEGDAGDSGDAPTD